MKVWRRCALRFFWRHPQARTWGLLSPAAFWLLLFVVAPVFIVLYYSFLTRGELGQVVQSIFTLENYQRTLNITYMKVFIRSLRLAFLTTIFCLAIGYPIAYWIALYGGKRKNLLIALFILPFWTSYLIRLFSWMFLLRDTGFINTLLLNLHVIAKPITMLYNEFGVLVGLVYTYLPFAVVPLYASLERLDRSVLEAAFDLGANPFQRLIKVTLPLTRGGILSGSVLVFVPTIGEYLVPDLMGGAKVNMIGKLIGEKFLVIRDWPFGSALSLFLMIVVLLLIFAYMKISRSEEAFEERR